MSNSASSPHAEAVMLIGHGTRDPKGTEQFFELGERLAERLSPLAVQPALLEFQEPTIGQAWDRLVEGGATQVHVAPLLLFAAGHAKADIPAALAECQARSPHVSFDQSRPISRHRAIVDLVVQRVGQARSQAESDRATTALVMVGRGNRDPCAQADMRVLSEIVSKRVDATNVSTAFYAMAEPALPAVLDRVAADGRYRTIIVQPHLLFAGRLYDAIGRQVDEVAERYANIDFRLAPYLGPDALVAEAIAGRIAQI